MFILIFCVLSQGSLFQLLLLVSTCCHMNRLAYVGAEGAPIAVPMSCKKKFLSNSRMLSSWMSLLRLTRKSVGTFWSSLVFNAFLRHSNPSSLGMLLWHRIKALLLRQNSDWCGNWCGRRSRRGMAVSSYRRADLCTVFYCGHKITFTFLYSKFLQITD